MGRLSCEIHGQVQGVGFRWFVRERARRLGLVGTVRNGDGGTVQVRAAGPSTALAALRAALAEGPPGAVVTRIDEGAPTLEPLPDPFEIIR
jgi:acylphosphatase